MYKNFYLPANESIWTKWSDITLFNELKVPYQEIFGKVSCTQHCVAESAANSMRWPL